MPNQLREDKTRISFAEEKEVPAELKRIAKAEGKTATDLIREGVRGVLNKEERRRRKQKPKK